MTQQKPQLPAHEQGNIQKVVIGRQPIYNNRLGVYGYELLFQPAELQSEKLDIHHETAHLVNNALLHFGLDNLVGGNKAAIEVTASFLNKIETLPFAAEETVLNLPMDINLTAELLAVLTHLSKKGFLLSYQAANYERKLKSFYSVIDIVKLNTSEINPRELRSLVKKFQRFDNLALLATGVETLEEYAQYVEVGFTYCQGRFLTKPRVFATKTLPSSSFALLDLLAAVNNEETEFSQLSEIISKDISLSYKLMKLVNSSFFGLSNEVDSLQQALTLLGRSELASWVSLMVMAGTNDKPIVLMDIALARAKMCEQFAERSALSSDSYFTVGLFSMLDQIMEQSMESLLNKLPLHDSVKRAILHFEGNMGKALRCAIACEMSDWHNVKFKNVTCQELMGIYIESIGWANRCLAAMNEKL